MTIWNDDYLQEAKKINTHINNNLEYLFSTKLPLEADSDQTFLNQLILDSWNKFYSILSSNRDDLDEYTKFNQKHLEERVKPTLDAYKDSPSQFLGLLARILYEYYFWNYDTRDYPAVLKSENLERLGRLTANELWGNQFEWINKSLAAALISDTIRSDDFKKLKSIALNVGKFEEDITNHINSSTQVFDDKFRAAKDRITNSLKNIDNLQTRLDEFESKLEGYKNEYNFTLLSRAFNNLKQSKERERHFGRVMTWILSLALSFPPIFSFLNHINEWVIVGEGIASLSYYLPLLTLELLIFYFMRLYYSEVRIANTQLLQIEHRLSLCEFIQDYIENKNADKDNKESWSLFESLIFSPIQATPDNIPSVIDGANAVADLAGKIMTKSKD